MRKLSAIAAALAALTSAVVMLGGPAAASASDEGRHDLASPPAELELSIRSIGDVDDGLVGQPDVVTLTCAPDGGTHPTPVAACDSLRAVDGHFERLPSTGDMCPTVYDPVRVEATGTWGERAVRYVEDFTNRCFAEVGTDGVFAF